MSGARDILAEAGDNIRRARIARGYTQETFAALIGKDKAAVSKIETGQCNMTLSTLAKIAAALEVRLEVLLNNKSQRNMRK